MPVADLRNNTCSTKLCYDAFDATFGCRKAPINSNFVLALKVTVPLHAPPIPSEPCSLGRKHLPKKCLTTGSHKCEPHFDGDIHGSARILHSCPARKSNCMEPEIGS